MLQAIAILTLSLATAAVPLPTKVEQAEGLTDPAQRGDGHKQYSAQQPALKPVEVPGRDPAQLSEWRDSEQTYAVFKNSSGFHARQIFGDRYRALPADKVNGEQPKTHPTFQRASGAIASHWRFMTGTPLKAPIGWNANRSRPKGVAKNSPPKTAQGPSAQIRMTEKAKAREEAIKENIAKAKARERQRQQQARKRRDTA